MKRQSGGRCAERAADLGECLRLDGGFAALILFFVAVEVRPLAIQPVGFVGFVVFTCLELLAQMGLERGFHIFDFALWDEAVFDQLSGIEAKRGLLFLDLFVHERVCEHGLVALVVAKPAVAENIDNHVFAKLLAELCRHFGRVDHGLRVVSIDVEDRRLDHQSDVCGVGRRPREMRRGGETDLVVDHNMHRAACAVAFEA